MPVYDKKFREQNSIGLFPLVAVDSDSDLN